MSVIVIPVTTLANGTQLSLYLHDLQGETGEGPTVGISAAIHGDELTGTLIIWELVRRLAQKPLHGRVLLLPVGNPPALEGMTRNTPLDSLNLNRVFPGDRSGWFTEQLAAIISEVFISEIDVLIDLHSGGYTQTVDYVYILNDERLSRSFGSKVLYQPRSEKQGTMFPGTLSAYARDRGIPTVVVELGGGLIDQRPYVKRGVEGVMNLLRTLEVIQEPPFPPPPQQVIVQEIVTVRPSMGGLLMTEAPLLGQEVHGGAVLGRVISPYTFEELEVIRNPVPHGIMILSHLTTDLINPGDYGYMIGNVDGPSEAM